MSVTQLIAAYLSGSITYENMTADQQAAFQLFSAQGGFQGMSS